MIDKPATNPDAPLPAPGEIAGVVERVIYTNPENGYTVCAVQLDAAAGEAIVVGSLAGIKPRQAIRATGQWTEDKRFGRQFRVETFEASIPSTAEGIEAYLASGAIKGIGPAYAKRLVAKFGDDLFRILDEEPQKIRTVGGIGPKRCETIILAWDESRVLRSIVLYLQQHGIPMSFANRIHRAYGAEAIQRIEKNPYQLAIDIRGIGFKSADSIAQKLGVPTESLERVKAGVYFLMQEMAGEGQTLCEADALIQRAVKALTVDTTLVVQAVNTLKNEGHIILEVLPDGLRAVYLKSLHDNESSVASLIIRLLHTGKLLPRIPATDEVARFEKEYQFTLGEHQRLAVAQAVAGGVLVITGGPGTGKTTTLRAILRILERAGVSAVLCAPTGRAAKRMHEATGKPASTIHRLLQFSPTQGGYQRNAMNQVRGDFIVVDEASMVDIALADHLLRAIPPQSSLIIVGDCDQLPSVGPGNFLRDLVECGAIPVVRLESVFRQAGESLIITNAHRINRGLMPEFTTPSPAADFLFIPREDPNEILAEIVNLVANIIPAQHQLRPLEDIQVLAPMHRGIIGAQNLNRSLQERLNLARGGATRGTVTFRRGDKVMQVENDYDRDVFNGDIGIISSLDEENQVLTVDFDGRPVAYEFSELDELEPAYAITVHKSQGSEYPAVVIPVHTTHFVMLQRNLIYTAMTRGKRLVVMVGQKKALAIALRNQSAGVRFSGLGQRIARLHQGLLTGRSPGTP